MFKNKRKHDKKVKGLINVYMQQKDIVIIIAVTYRSNNNYSPKSEKKRWYKLDRGYL